MRWRDFHSFYGTFYGTMGVLFEGAYVGQLPKTLSLKGSRFTKVGGAVYVCGGAKVLSITPALRLPKLDLKGAAKQLPKSIFPESR